MSEIKNKLNKLILFTTVKLLKFTGGAAIQPCSFGSLGSALDKAGYIRTAAEIQNQMVEGRPVAEVIS